MSKIICEICGTKYPDTVEQCPICGYTNGVTAKSEVEEDILEEVVQESRPRTKGGRFSKSNVRKRNQEEIRYEEEPEEKSDFDEDDDRYKENKYEQDEDGYEDDDDEEEEGGKSGVVLNILLGIVIVALLCVSGFIFVRYFLPDIMASRETIPNTEPYVESTDIQTEEPTVPCAELVLDQTDVELDDIGQMYLLNVAVQPEDTTDMLVFTSSDENVVTVNEEGRVTAVAEGTAVVTITCGEQKIECTVTVVLPEETEAPTEEPTEEPAEPGVSKTVTNSFVNIRAGAGTQYEKVGEYKKGDVVVIYEETTVKGRPWGRTDKGWICLDYVE